MFVALCVLLGCRPPSSQKASSPLAAYQQRLTYNPIDKYRYACTSIDSTYINDNLVELERRFGTHLVADAYRDRILAALAFYPNLRGVEIHLRHKKLRTSMAARPLRLGGGPGHRRYAIYVDDVSERASDFRKASYSAQVGCFLHELGHLSHYERTANAELISEGVAYVTNQHFKSDYEKIADDYVIRNGGGYYLYEYRVFSFEEAGLPEEYLAFKARNYEQPRDLLARHLAYVAARGSEKCN